ncbi:hypothetical protein [uncultured Winogradskyella sp.]|uniref:hypothetical protein n=1 Tax=uncultured Winogradskyella sp. TaxID=395353 RepID=UPI00260DE99A|nr:hypothetical protein [uncultured Winogradskyella sp.]|tara:strand:+ start:1655 stop:2089 length:435 start_codon:yes stop_codon:yes gene_type:complete
MISDKPTLDKPLPKNKRKPLKDYFDFRNNQVNQIGLILFSAFIISSSLHYFFENRFSEQRWKQSPMGRYEMLDDIIERNLFINDTKREVIKQLGYPKEPNYNEVNQFNYYVGERDIYDNGDIKQLSIIFKNNRVIQTLITPSKD